MRRGDIVIVAVKGDHGKPRPALVIQADEIDDIDTVLVCLFTSNSEPARSFRYTVEPSPGNGLKAPSSVMIDKVTIVLREKIQGAIGRLSSDQMMEVDLRLAFVLGLGR
jgi:mRNA interferase MazF